MTLSHERWFFPGVAGVVELERLFFVQPGETRLARASQPLGARFQFGSLMVEALAIRTCRFPARWCSAAPIRRGLIPHRGVENILGIACVFALGGPESSKGCVSTAPLRRATGGLTRDPVPSTVPGFDRRRTPLARLSAIRWPSKASLFQVAKLGSLRRPSDFRGNNTFVAVDVHRVSVLICAYTGKEVVG